MKQCPECGDLYHDNERFCDQDGASLMDPTNRFQEALHNGTRQQSLSLWMTGIIGGLLGVTVCGLLYLGFVAPRNEGVQNRSSQPETIPRRSAQIATAPAPLNTPLPAVEPSPETEEESPSPTESPTTQPPVATNPALNTGPIATGTREKKEGMRAIIKMKDGSSVEAEAAWEDSDGIWYRRSGLVSFVERSRVESITDPTQREPAKPEVKTP